MLVKLLQPLKALLPILVTLSGISMLVSPLQPSNALLPILVTLLSEGITLDLQPAIRVLVAVSIMQLPSLWYFVLPLATVMLVKLLQPLNAPNINPNRTL